MAKKPTVQNVRTKVRMLKNFPSFFPLLVHAFTIHKKNNITFYTQ